MLNRLKLIVVPLIGSTLIRLLGKTLRLRFEGFEPLEAFHRQKQAVILAFWHGRQLMLPLAYRGQAVNILISRHRDGELIHRVMARFGYKAVRGSTTRGGGVAFRRMVALGRSGEDLAITPDGPRGPRQVVKDGVIHLAKATGLPIIPVTFSCSKKKSLQAGTDSRSRIRSAGDSIGAARRFGYRPTLPNRNCTTSGSNWRPS